MRKLINARACRGRPERRPAASRWTAPVLGLAVMALVPAPLLAQSNAADQEGVPMDQLDMAVPQAGAAVAPEQQSPFIRDTVFFAQLRTYYLFREKYDDSNSEAWALGGSVGFKSGYLADRFAVSAVGYTSQPLYAPDDRDGTLLLAPGQEGYTVLGQAYGEFKFAERVFAAVGRKEYNTPYINKNDFRMTPNTFEGITLYGTAGGKDGAPEWRFGGGFISKIKERNSDEFVWMSRDAGAGVDRGVYAAGANYKVGNFSLGAAEYYSDDIINIFYTEAKYAFDIAEGYKLRLAAQYSDQRSTGDDLLEGYAYETYQAGAKVDLGAGAAQWILAYTLTDDEADIQSPWGVHPGYTSIQVQDFNRAGEAALMLKAVYDFTRLGATGLSTYALWVHGEGRPAPAYDEDELNLNLQWTPAKTSALRGLSLRVRYAQVMQRGGGDPVINDFRIIVNYDFPRPGP